ncbi:MAG: ABC transporter substrate-binding protein [Propionibacteriaceae bacterium]|nr:ABC transporter substrate-binding protein [Propionibacteriaceae bacterium]
MNLRRCLVVACLLALVCSIGACSTRPATPADPAQQTLVVGASLEPPTLDPTGSDAASIPQVLLYNVYETLLKLDSQGKFQPLLADSWQVSADRLTYTFTLKPAQFESGRAVSAKDVAWSINKIKAGKNVAAASQLAVVRSVQAKNATTAVITLTKPSNSWLFNMASTAGMVFDSSATRDLATTPAGSGPYALDRWTKGSDLVLKRNDGYWGTKANFASVTFRYFTDPNAMNSAMLSNGLDVISNLQVPQALPQFADATRYRVIDGTTNGEVVMSLNNQAPALRDVRVRRAINYAIDRAALKKTVWNDKGTLIGSMVPPTDPWYQDLAGAYPYDPAKARQLLKDAGYATGLTLRMRIPVVPYATTSGQFVASQLKDVGITVKTDELEFPRWLDLVFTKADYDISIVAHVEARDIVRFANPKYYFRYDNPKFARLVTEADEGTEAEQLRKMRAAAKMLSDDAAADWLFLLPNLVVTRSSIQGVAENATTLSFALTSITKSA